MSHTPLSHNLVLLYFVVACVLGALLWMCNAFGIYDDIRTLLEFDTQAEYTQSLSEEEQELVFGGPLSALLPRSPQ